MSRGEPSRADGPSVLEAGRPAGSEIAPQDRLDVCMTALRRPELLELTLASFARRVFPGWRHVRLIANVDPLGDPAALEPTLALMRRYSDASLVRVTAAGNFTDAVRWCWRQVRTPMVLHLEDDWLCLRRVSRARVEHAIRQDRVGAVRLYLHRVPLRRRKRDIGFTLNPCFFEGAWLTQLAECLDDALDPEKQIRWARGRCAGPAAERRTVMYGLPGEPRVVADIGRDWRARRGLVKELVDGQARWVQHAPSAPGLALRWRDRWLRLRAQFP